MIVCMAHKGYTVTTVHLGVFNVSIQYLWKPKNCHTWDYRRAVPAAVKHHYFRPTFLSCYAQKVR